MDQKLYDSYVKILKNELVPALGCTEPIAIAYAAAKAREVLGQMPESIELCCSGNIIKNRSTTSRSITMARTAGILYLYFKRRRRESLHCCKSHCRRAQRGGNDCKPSYPDFTHRKRW